MSGHNRCSSCGSHEYTRASGTIICSYCRVPKDGFTVRESSESTKWDEMYRDLVEFKFKSRIHHHKFAARIEKDWQE